MPVVFSKCLWAGTRLLLTTRIWVVEVMEDQVRWQVAR